MFIRFLLSFGFKFDFCGLNLGNIFPVNGYIYKGNIPIIPKPPTIYIPIIPKLPGHREKWYKIRMSIIIIILITTRECDFFWDTI